MAFMGKAATTAAGKKGKPPARRAATRPGKKTSGRKAAGRADAPAPSDSDGVRKAWIDPIIPRTARSLAVASGAAPEVNTVIYVHGIGNKPEAAVLKCQWDRALFGIEMGDRTRMAYWVNRERYPTPLPEDCAAGDTVDEHRIADAGMFLGAATPGSASPDVTALIEDDIQRMTADPDAQTVLRRLGAAMVQQAEAGSALAARDVRAKILPLPGFLRKLLTRFLTRTLLEDVNEFLFDADRRAAMEQSLIDRLNAGGGPFVVIAHSQGSMIAYDVLRRLGKADADVRLFLTIGSPLGIQEVQDVLSEAAPLQNPACVDRWVNVADRLDPVAADPFLANDFTPGDIVDIVDAGLNRDSPRHPHSATGYLHTNDVRTQVRNVVGNAFSQILGRALLTRDLVRDMENAHREERHDALIQLHAGAEGSLASVEAAREKVQQAIEALVVRSGAAPGSAQVDHMRRFVAAKLTRLELESLRTMFEDLQIERVWRDAGKRALIYASSQTIQARPANLGYEANGVGIGWAVLDTGIRADHPHFHDHRNVVMQWDCTERGKAAIRYAPGHPKFDSLDDNGHGTHVAGIIAGEYRDRLVVGQDEVKFQGMAPKARLYGFKVLDDNGRGNDSSIIKALDEIARINEEAGELVIHGVNLSLGGGFDPSVYGCGHTPLCQELRRLWNQGVLVCLAAGNEGYAVLRAEDGDVAANMDLSIGDPANLDEAIAVGSIHKSNPHTFGVSFFSSRGPTADGRKKPDLVAPGEQILSCFHAFSHQAKPSVDNLYIEMSGTSMAAPHVSGLLAAFLSVRREFIGYPNRVKQILLANCTDLQRDPYIQGAGMPNLVRMLTAT